MKHLFDNGEGELVVADTLEQAHHYHDVELSGEKDPKELDSLKKGWSQIDDEAVVPIIEADIPPTIVDGKHVWQSEKKKAKDWAAEHDVPTQIATTYW